MNYESPKVIKKSNNNNNNNNNKKGINLPWNQRSRKFRLMYNKGV